MGVSIGHARDLMTIAQVSYNVTASVHAAPATNCVASVILPGVFVLSLYRVGSASHFTGCVRPLTITLLTLHSDV